MKVSEVSLELIKSYLRIDYFDDDDYIQNVVFPAVKAYIKGYTGLDDTAIDTKEDITSLFFVLCSEMYNNRDYTVQNDKVNKVIQSILDMHCINLL